MTIDESTLPADPADLPQPRRPLSRGTMIDRFLVLEERGAGGMGRVYAAYDPELDRRVAIKLVRLERLAPSELGAASARLLREAQTMAKVSHPNVVAVFDVGTFEDQLFLAMELIDGPNLAEWTETRRPWREVLAMYEMAGRGLAAAHAAGLVHRDFKPSNVIVAGAVAKVSDFGLAKLTGEVAASDDEAPTVSSGSLPRSHDMTAPGAMVGTPRYMAPEQREGRADARADQFSFCRSVEEAMRAASGTPPRRLLRVLERGQHPDPAARFASMDALLAALDRAARRRAPLALGAVGFAVLAAGVAFAATRDREPACGDPRARLAGIWDAPTRAARAEAFARASDAGARLYDAVAGALDGYAERWTLAHRETCEATRVRQEQSVETMDREMACLDARRAELGALVEQLAAVDAASLPAMTQAVHKLRSVESCGDVALVAASEPAEATARERVAAIRVELASARALGHVGKWADGLAIAEQAVAHARALAWRPALAEALLEAGMLALQAGKAADGERMLLEAVWNGEASRHDAAAAEAWTMLVFSVVQQGDALERAEPWATRADAAIERLGGDRDLRGRLENHLGAVAYLSGKFPDAKTHWERSLAETTALHREDHPDVARVENNLGIVLDELGDAAGAEQHYRRAIAIWERALGAEHPHVAAALTNLGSLIKSRGDTEEAIALYRRAIAIYEASVGAEHPSLADPLQNLGNALLPLGRVDEAIAHFDRALAIRTQAFGADSPQAAAVLTSLGTAYRQGKQLDRAVEVLERALAIQRATTGADHPKTAIALTALGEVHLTRGDHRAARAVLEPARAIFEKTHGPDHPYTAYALSGLGRALLAAGEVRAATPLLERAVAARAKAGTPAELAESRFALAQARWKAGDREGAWELVELAREALDPEHIDPDMDLDAWIAAHPR